MTSETLRLDKWLWHARFCKSRTAASELCTSGRARINGALVKKAHSGLKPGDVVTFTAGGQIRVVRVIALGTRRGPASEAQLLYEEIEAPIRVHPRQADVAASREQSVLPLRAPGAGRPTKADRRAIDRLRDPSPSD